MKALVWLFILVVPLTAAGDGKKMAPSIQDVKKRHELRLLAMPDVVSVGIGLNPEGQTAIVIGLKAPNPDAEAKIPPTLDGYPVLIQIVGAIKAQ
jgi:hypothetical protein